MASMSEPKRARELDITLERNSPVPLYYQLAQSIEQAINDGVLSPGDRLENELSLTTRLGLSRPTARQAIQELVNKGLLVRKRGVGTQVVRSQFSRDERLTSLNADLVQAGKVPSTQLLGFSVGPLDHRRRLRPGRRRDHRAGVHPGPTAAAGRRRAPGHPHQLPAGPLRPSREALEHRSLYATCSRLGVNLKIAHQRISARLMSDDEAELLDEEVPAACLTVDRITYDDTGQFVEFGRHVYRAAQYSIQSNLMV